MLIISIMPMAEHSNFAFIDMPLSGLCTVLSVSDFLQ